MEEVIVADGGRIAVRRERTAGHDVRATVLLLHGWPGTSTDWDHVIDELRGIAPDGTDIVAPDLRGFGRCVRPAGTDPADLGPAAHVADLRAILDQLHAARVIVAGYDLGATLAQHLARADDRVVGLVLGCPPYPGIGQRRYEPAVQAELWYQQLHQQPWVADLVAHDRATVETYLRHFYTHWWGDGSVDETRFQAVVDAYATPGAFEASIGWYRARARARNGSADATAVGTIALPTAVLWGDRDPVNPVRFADRLGEFFQPLTFTALPGVGHFVPLEAPREMAAAITQIANR